MKIPNKLKIGGHIVKVLKDYKFIERSDIVGQAIYCQNEIRLCSQTEMGPIAEGVVAANFLHEIFHHVCERYNGEQLPEEVVVRVSEGLFQVLRDNKLRFDEP